MHKLLERIENELHEFGEKGISKDNVAIIGELVDMYKDLKYVEHMHKKEDLYDGEGSEMKAENMERRADSRFDRNINELYDKYLWCKKEYARDGSEVHKGKVVESLEKLMSEVCDLLFDIYRDCDFKAERDVLEKYKKSMEQIS